MKRWSKFRYLWLVTGLLFGVASLIFSQKIYAVGPNNLECVDFNGNVVCPDLYCATGSLTCDPDINQCYCHPLVMSTIGAKQNAYCEIATGSEMFFTRDSAGRVDKVVLKKGLWGAMAQGLERIYGGSVKEYDVDVDNKAIIFRRDDQASRDSTYYFTSRFINLFNETGWDNLVDKFGDFYDYEIVKAHGLFSGEKTYVYPDDMLRPFAAYYKEISRPKILNLKGDMRISFYANIENVADSGTIHNQMFEVTSNNQKQVCGVIALASGKTFYNKASGIPVSEIQHTACVGVPDLLVRVILPTGKKSDGVVSGNIERGLLAQAQLTRTCVGFEVKEGAAWNSADELEDPYALIGQLIVPHGKERPIYQFYVENQYMGLIFNGKPANETEEQRQQRINQRKENVKKAQEACQSCHDKTRTGAIPPYCNLCSGEILAQLGDRNSVDKPFTAIVAQELRKNNCYAVTPSFGYINETDFADYPKYDSDTKSTGENPKTEKQINKSLPKSLIKICEDNFGNNQNNRIACKANGLQCYIEKISPELSGKDICAFMDKSESLRRGRWIFCPVLKTEVVAADLIQDFINKLFATSTTAFQDTRIENLWHRARDVANIILIIAFLMIILAQVTGFGLSNYQVKTLLPKVLVSAILVNLSFFITQLGVDVSNLVGDGIVGFLNNIKLINVNQSSFEVLVFKASSSVLVMAGVLALAIPILLLSILGIITLLIILALRRVMIIVLIFIAPVAFGLMGIPGGDKLTKRWWRTFLILLAIYPVTQFTYSAAKLTGDIMSSIGLSGDGTAVLMKIVAGTIPFVSIVLIPFITKKMFSSVSKLTASLTSGTETLSDIAKTRGQLHAKNSYLRQSIKGYVGQNVGNFLMGNTATRRKKGKGAWVGSKSKAGRLLDAISFGAGQNLANRIRGANQNTRNKISGMIGDDVVLLQALIYEQGKQGSYYKNLSEAQKRQYNLILSLDAGELNNLNAVAPVILAKNGVTEQKLYQTAIDNAAATGVKKNEFIGLAYGTAKSGGDIEVMGILRAHMQARPRDVKASNDISDTSTILGFKQELRRYIIENSGDLRHLDEDIKSNSWSGLANELSTGNTTSKLHHLTSRDLLAAAVDSEASSAIFNQQSRDLITKGLTTLSESGGKFIAGANGEIDSLTDSQLEALNYTARTLEMINVKLGDNGEHGQPPIEFKNLGLKFSKNTHGDQPSANQRVNQIIGDTSTASLPTGWSEDRRENLQFTKYDLETAYDKDLGAVPVENYYSKLFDDTRTANNNLGVATTHVARDRIINRLKNIDRDPRLDLDLSHIVERFEHGNSPSTAPTDINLNILNHNIYSLGRSWNRLPTSVQNQLSAPIIEGIFNSMEAQINKSYPNLDQASKAQRLKQVFGVTDLDDAKRIGTVGMLKLIDITPDRIER